MENRAIITRGSKIFLELDRDLTNRCHDMLRRCERRPVQELVHFLGLDCQARGFYGAKSYLTGNIPQAYILRPDISSFSSLGEISINEVNIEEIRSVYRMYSLAIISI